MTYGVSYGISNSIIVCAYAAAFTYGTKLVGDGEMEFYAVFRSVSHLVSCFACGAQEFVLYFVFCPMAVSVQTESYF